MSIDNLFSERGKIAIDKFVIMCYLFVTKSYIDILSKFDYISTLHYILYCFWQFAEYFVEMKNYILDKIGCTLFLLCHIFGIMRYT